jgi:hypothetical protein
MIRLYRGVLKEYSDSYLCLYNVYYRLPRAAEYDQCKFLGLDPALHYIVKGKPVARDQDLDISFDPTGRVLTLSNRSGHYLSLTKVQADGKSVEALNVMIQPEGEQTLTLGGPCKKIRLEYEEAFASDVVLPRRLAVVEGRAEPQLPNLEEIRKFAGKVKNVPANNIKDIQSKLFISKSSDETASMRGWKDGDAGPGEPKE